MIHISQFLTEIVFHNQMKPQILLRAARVNFLPASILPFLTGTALALRSGAGLSSLKLFLGLAGVITAHIAGNLLNDYFDHRSGVDVIKKKESPFSGGSGMIQKGLVSPPEVITFAVLFLSVSIICGLAVFVITGDPVFLAIMVLAGIFLVGYTAPPLKLAYRMLGELDIFVLFGIFMVMSAFYLFSGKIGLDSFFAGLPVSFLVLSVIICNEIPDTGEDEASGKHNLITFIGKEKGYLIYSMAVILSYLSVLLNAGMGIVAPFTVCVAFVYIPGIVAAMLLKKYPDSPEDLVKAGGLTIFLHGAAGSGMIAGILLK